MDVGHAAEKLVRVACDGCPAMLGDVAVAVAGHCVIGESQVWDLGVVEVVLRRFR